MQPTVRGKTGEAGRDVCTGALRLWSGMPHVDRRSVASGSPFPSQSLVTQLLYHWKYDGYTRWLHGLAIQYKTRRDWFIDCLSEELHLEATTSSDVSFWKDCVVYDAYAKRSSGWMMAEKGSIGTKLFSFVPPTSGMFLWVGVRSRTIGPSSCHTCVIDQGSFRQPPCV